MASRKECEERTFKSKASLKVMTGFWASAFAVGSADSG
jgi:hypothetical protein